MSKQGVDRTRRRLLTITTGIGAVGVGFVAAPFVISMMPSARAKAAGAPVEVDISKIEPGMKLGQIWEDPRDNQSKLLFSVSKNNNYLDPANAPRK